MPYKYLKKLNLSNWEMHTILYEFLVYVLDWTDIDNDPGGGSFGLLASGTGGVVTAAAPNRINDSSGSFVVGHEDKWCVVFNSQLNQGGIFQVGKYIDANTIELKTGLGGPNFRDEIPVSWRIIDPSLNVGTSWFVVQNAIGTQVRFYTTGSTTQIFYQVGPFAGWDVTGHTWTQPVTSDANITIGTSENWYWSGPNSNLNTHIVGWAEEDFNTCNSLCYAGAIVPFRPIYDPSPSICLGGDPDLLTTGFLGGSLGGQIAADDTTPVDALGLQCGDEGTGNYSMFHELEPNAWDGSWDEVDLAIHSDAGANSEIRGVVKDLRGCSTLLGYKTPINSNRTRVALGNGVSVVWDGGPVS